LLVERARYEAERAERQFTRVEPENRLVARSLELAWEQRLHDLVESQNELAGFRRRRPTPLSQGDAEWLRRAGSDLKAVWNAPTTTNRDRKHLLRCLISEVVVFVDRERTVADLTIRWAGGASTKLTSPLNHTGGHRYVTSDQVNELIRQVAPYYADEQIAFMLNMKHLRTGHGNSFTAARVGHVRRGLGLPTADPARLPDSNDPTWISVKQAAKVLGVSPDTIRRWAREGSLEANQVMPQAPWRIHVTDEVVARMVPDAPNGWVGLTAAAKALGRAKQTILHWVHSGKLRSVQVRSGKRKGLRIELKHDEIGLFAEGD
jgi:excisionase family DNA binding protein